MAKKSGLSAAELREQAEQLAAQANDLEAQEAADALQAARDAETPEQTEAREAAEAAAAEAKAKEEAEALAQHQLHHEPTDDHLATTIGVDMYASGDYSYIERPDADQTYRSPRLVVNGQNVEHVAEDRFGRWLYRAM